MATFDFATVDAYADEHRMEIYIPFEQKALGNFVKEKFGARFKTDGNKKRWVIEYKFCKVPPLQIPALIEEELFRLAFPDWKKIVGMFTNYACASKRYEVKFGAGGLRIMLPGGHPLHFYLNKMCGLKPDRDVWKIPASLVDPKEVGEMLKRISKEDREVFTDATEPYEGRSITGKLLVPWSEAERFGLGPDEIVFADFAFLKIADPQVVPMQIHAWPFRVAKMTPTEGGINTTLAYMPPANGARSVGKLMALPKEERPLLLDAANVEEKWKSKSG